MNEAGSSADKVGVSLDIPSWSPPWPSSTGTYVRLSPTHLRERGCAEQVAKKARPDVFPDERGPWEPTGLGSFPLGLVRDSILTLLTAPLVDPMLPPGAPDHNPIAAAIDLAIEESWDEWPPDSRPVVEAGVIGYLEVLESLRADGSLPRTVVVPDLVAVQDPHGERVELWAWAVHHISEDGALRECHLLRWRAAGSVLLPDEEAALIAHVTASGVIAEHAKWYQWFEPERGRTQPPTPERVRVRIIGVLDGTSDVRFEGTAHDAEAALARTVPGHLAMLAGGAHSPSSGCATCAVRHVCSGPLRMPGLLGVAGYSPRTRAVSPSDLWTHRACARQLYLTRDLGLPRTPVTDTAALARGTQVHAWLAAAHGRGAPCSVDDLPEYMPEDQPDQQDSIAGLLGWTAEDYATNRPFLLQHLDLCPLRDPDNAEFTTEVPVTAWDTDANIVFSTRPDAAWRRSDGRWVLRETKTLSPRGLPDDRTTLLQSYTQVAAAICLLADGFTPDSFPADTPGVVELELLGPDEGAVITYDANDPVVVLVARTNLADRVDAWLFDTEHPIGDSPPCRTCPVFDWCEVSPLSAVEELTAGLIPDSIGVLGWQVPDAVMRDVAGADVEEEFPF